eukprot:COSAG01_NODE_389_length_17708_cov_111.404452_19_plen_42_part_00
MAPRARRQLGGGWGTVTAVDRAQGFYTVEGGESVRRPLRPV